MNKIDAHQHFWQLSRGDYGWLTAELATLYHDFLPPELLPVLQQHQVEQTVLVQAAATTAETDFMLNLASEYDFIGGVVGWVDMASDDALLLLEIFQTSSYFKGIRPMIQDIADPNWMLKKELAPVFEALIERELTFDALVTPRHLDALHTLLLRYPELQVVIDHGAKPNIAQGAIDSDSGDSWFDKLALIAADTSAYCKLSGLVTEAGEQPSYQKIVAYMDHLLTSFGPTRLMWGSDWPVIKLAGTYQDWVGYVEAFVGSLPLEQQQAIWAGNAKKFYRL